MLNENLSTNKEPEKSGLQAALVTDNHDKRDVRSADAAATVHSSSDKETYPLSSDTAFIETSYIGDSFNGHSLRMLKYFEAVSEKSSTDSSVVFEKIAQLKANKSKNQEIGYKFDILVSLKQLFLDAAASAKKKFAKCADKQTAKKKHGATLSELQAYQRKAKVDSAASGKKHRKNRYERNNFAYEEELAERLEKRFADVFLPITVGCVAKERWICASSRGEWLSFLEEASDGRSFNLSVMPMKTRSQVTRLRDLTPNKSFRDASDRIATEVNRIMGFSNETETDCDRIENLVRYYPQLPIAQMYHELTGRTLAIGMA